MTCALTQPRPVRSSCKLQVSACEVLASCNLQSICLSRNINDLARPTVACRLRSHIASKSKVRRVSFGEQLNVGRHIRRRHGGLLRNQLALCVRLRSFVRSHYGFGISYWINRFVVDSGLFDLRAALARKILECTRRSFEIAAITNHGSRFARMQSRGERP